MRLLQLDPTPLFTFPCVNTAPGARGVVRTQIPVLHAHVVGLPESLEALIIASDLQCFDTDHVPPVHRRLMGAVLAEELHTLAQVGALPDPERTGVILAGDLYAIPTLNKRGGLGDVHQIWDRFRQNFAWVAGVAGNHDLFFGRDTTQKIASWPGCYPLHGACIDRDGLKLGGIDGLIGNSGKPWRTPESSWNALARHVLGQKPDLFVLHQGPEHKAAGLSGHHLVNTALDSLKPGAKRPLVICGHAHWDTPWTTLEDGTQVLNVDFRVVVMTRPHWKASA